MSEQIVYVDTTDSLRQAGLLISPNPDTAKGRAVVWCHGLSSNFYEPFIVEIGRFLASKGCAFLSGNNRGHDFGSLFSSTHGPVLHGSGWEIYEHSARDIRAWVDFAGTLGYRTVVLVGHSLGALKAIDYLAQTQDTRIEALVAASPPMHAGVIDAKVRSLAERMSEQGQGRNLLPWGAFPVSIGTLSARSYLHLNWATPQAIHQNLGRIRCPVLVFYGTEEPTIGGKNDLYTIRSMLSASTRVRAEMIEGADHAYAGRVPEVSVLLSDWLTQLAGPTPID